jgi:glycine cleavage system transcriptional repressor
MEYEHCRAGFPHSRETAIPQLFIQITAHSPATQNASNIEQAFKALCTELNAQGSINIVNYSQHDEQDGV